MKIKYLLYALVPAVLHYLSWKIIDLVALCVCCLSFFAAKAIAHSLCVLGLWGVLYCNHKACHSTLSSLLLLLASGLVLWDMGYLAYEFFG